MFHLVATHLLYQLYASGIGVCIVHAKVILTDGFFDGLVFKETLILRPLFVGQEVFLALFGNDDTHLCGVESGKDAVATEDKVFRAQCTGAVLLGPQTQVEGAQSGAAHEG